MQTCDETDDQTKRPNADVKVLKNNQNDVAKDFESVMRKVVNENQNLTVEQQDQLATVLLEHRLLWASGKLGQVNLDYDIEVLPWQVPIKQLDRRWSLHEIEVIRNEISQLLQKKYIEPAKSPWSSRLVLVTKKDGTTRVCVDYRKLNTVTTTDAYPTPRVDTVIDRLAGNKFFSTVDCEKGYYQVPLTERTKEITTFTCPIGQFQWLRMPFGLKNAPAVFQRLMDSILLGLSWQCCMVFFDDVVIFSKTITFVTSTKSSLR